MGERERAHLVVQPAHMRIHIPYRSNVSTRCSNRSSQRGEGGVGFLVCDCLMNGVEFITSVKYDESVWMKVRGERGRSALFVCCVYLPTDSSRDSYYNRLKEDVLGF